MTKKFQKGVDNTKRMMYNVIDNTKCAKKILFFNTKSIDNTNRAMYNIIDNKKVRREVKIDE